MLGHANIGVTLDTYSHLIPGLGDAAEAMDDALFPKSICDREPTSRRLSRLERDTSIETRISLGNLGQDLIYKQTSVGHNVF